jgi:hypothetical protein
VTEHENNAYLASEPASAPVDALGTGTTTGGGSTSSKAERDRLRELVEAGLTYAEAVAVETRESGNGQACLCGTGAWCEAHDD